MDFADVPADVFDRNRNRRGACFELVMAFPAQAPAEAAMQALWSHTSLCGPLSDDGSAPSFARFMLGVGPADETCWGAARLPCGVVIACLAEAFPSPTAPGLTLSVFEADLGSAYDIGIWPIDDGSTHSWVVEVADSFRSIGEHVYCAVRYSAAAVGCELDERSLRRRVADVPEERCIGYLVPEGDHVRWFGPTVLRAPVRFG